MQEVATGESPVTIFSFDEKQHHINVVLRLNRHMKMRCRINKADKHYQNDIKRMIKAVKDWQKEKK